MFNYFCYLNRISIRLNIDSSTSLATAAVLSHHLENSGVEVCLAVTHLLTRIAPPQLDKRWSSRGPAIISNLLKRK